MSYVKAAKELPFLTQDEVEAEALRYGLTDTVSRGAATIDPEKIHEDNVETSSRDKSE